MKHDARIKEKTLSCRHTQAICNFQIKYVFSMKSTQILPRKVYYELHGM